MKTIEAAHGRWREILPLLGVSVAALNGKHQACPACGGHDRFRFDDRNGNGDYFCSGCGAGQGIKLLMNVNGWDYAEAARRVDEIIGNLPEKAPARQEPKKIDTYALALDIWQRSRPIDNGPVSAYLASRGLAYSGSELRFVPDLFNTDTGTEHPAMIARVRDTEGKGQTLHRTYLTWDGQKAAVEKPRKLMRGEFPKGGAVRLFSAGEVLGVAEGIETALAASMLFGVPVWSTISEGLLQAWQPPQEAKHVIVFGDNDKNFVGQHAAYALARRLSLEGGVKVEVRIPDCVSWDWNDVLLLRIRETNAFIKVMENAAHAA